MTKKTAKKKAGPKRVQKKAAKTVTIAIAYIPIEKIPPEVLAKKDTRKP